RLGRATAAIDVSAIGFNKQGHNPCTQLGEDTRRYVVGGTVGAIEHYLHTLQVKTPGHGALAEFDVTTSGIGYAPRLTQALSGDHGLFQLIFDQQLYLIRQLGAVSAKKFDA